MRLVKNANQTLSIFSNAGDQVFRASNRFSLRVSDSTTHEGDRLEIIDESEKSYAFLVSNINHLQNIADGQTAPGTPFASNDAQVLIAALIAQNFLKIQ